MIPVYFILAQASQTPPPSTDSNLGIYGLVAAAVVWFLKNRFGIKIPLLDKPTTPTIPIPLPDDTPTTGRPILDWMTAVILQQYGSDPKIAKAIKEQMEAIKAILDAANIPSPLGQQVNKP